MLIKNATAFELLDGGKIWGERNFHFNELSGYVVNNFIAAIVRANTYTRFLAVV